MSHTKRLLRVLAAFSAALVTITTCFAAPALAKSPSSHHYPPSSPPPPSSSHGRGHCHHHISNSSPAAGSSVTVSCDGFTPGETVSADLHSAPVNLGSTTADSSGVATIAVTIPSGFSGTHTLTLTGETSGVVEAFVINIGSGVSGLSATGVAILGIGVLAVVLLVGGGLLLYAGKRRKERTHA